MRIPATFFILALGGGVVSISMFAIFVYAGLIGKTNSAQIFLLSFLLASFFSMVMFFISKTKKIEKIASHDLFASVGLFWVLIPILGAFPFMAFSNIPEAYFESVSGLTTTGASLFAAPEETLDAPFILWRAMLHWVGGFWCLVFACAVFANIDWALKGSKPIDGIFHKEEGFGIWMRNLLLGVAKPYLGLTAFFVLGLVASGTDIFTSICLVFSAISTGGFMPSSASLDELVNGFGLGLLSLLMLLGATSYYVLYYISNLQFGKIKADVEFRHFIIAILFCTFLLMMSGNEISLSLMSAISLLSTTALPITFSLNAPLIVILAMLLVGGMSFSTAGGLKILRMGIFLKNILLEIKYLPFPNVSRVFYYGKRKIQQNTLSQLSLFFFSFLLGFVCLFVFVNFLPLSLNQQLLALIGTMSNAGGVVNMFGMPELFASMPSWGLGLFSFAMILGRIEIVLFFILLSKHYWKHI